MPTAEEREGWRARWVRALYEFARPGFQRRLWVEAAIANYVGSFTELVCGYFDDCHLAQGYERAIREGLVCPAEARAVEQFHRAADAYSTEHESDAEHLSDPAWKAVCSLAAEAWRELRGVAGSDVLAEMRRCEDRWGEVPGGSNPNMRGDGA